MDPKLWNLLHDGGLDGISGVVPGDLTLSVSIRYLRSRFPGAGVGFNVALQQCTAFSYTPYDEPPVSDLAAIVAQDLEILGAEAGDPLRIDCVTGTLQARYAAVRIELDTGGEVSIEALTTAARDYWREWDEKNRRNA